MITCAQPTPDLNPDDAEAIISAFLNNATELQMEDAAVDDLLEEIFRQDKVHGGMQASNTQEAHPHSEVPFHGPNSPISTPTEEDVAVEEDEDEEA